ncbi:MAG: hypothetical protein RIF41_40930 [Polyangiaceae bacterium]
MRVWTNGKAVFAWLPVGRLRIDLEDGTKSTFETGPDPDRRQADAYTDAELFAPALKKGVDLLAAYDGDAPIDAVATSDKDIAVVVGEDGGPLELRVGPPKGKKPKLAISLDAKGTPVSWPEATMWAASAPPPISSDSAFVAKGPRGARLSQSPHGLSIACGASGHVAVVRPGSKKLDFVLRLPCHDDALLHAVATEQGVLATLVVEDRHSLAVHLSEDGELLGRWPEDSFGWGMTKMALLGEHALVYEDQAQSLSLLRLPDLVEEQRQRSGTKVVDLAATTDGTSFAAAASTQVVVGRIEEKKDKARFTLGDTHSVAALVSFTESEDQTRVSRYRPERATDPATVGFSALKTGGPPWAAKAGEPFEITLTFRSAGEPGRGVVIQVGGAAVDDGHLTITHVRAGDDEVALDDEHRAELPDVQLVHGLTYPLSPKPKKAEDKEVGRVALEATHFEVTLKGEAKKKGAPLFWVSAGALSGTTPVKRTRPFNIG